MEPSTPGFIPEPSWKFRRILTFATSAFTAALLAYIATALATAGATASLLTLALSVIIWNGAVQLLYIAAPSAEYVSRIAELVRAARNNGTA
jgi:hypothetical protein